MAYQLECSSDIYLMQDPINIGVDCLNNALEALTLASQMAMGECVRVAETIHMEEFHPLIESFSMASTTMVWECEHSVKCCKYQNLEIYEIQRVLDSFFSVKDAMKVVVLSTDSYDESIVGALIPTFMDLNKKIKIFEILLQFIGKQLEL